MTTTDKPPEGGEIRRLRLADLDISLQIRSEIRLAAVGEYATQIGKGEQFPRPVVYEHDGNQAIADSHFSKGISVRPFGGETESAFGTPFVQPVDTKHLDEAHKCLGRCMSHVASSLQERSPQLQGDIEAVYYHLVERVARFEQSSAECTAVAAAEVNDSAESALTSLAIALDKLKQHDRPRASEAMKSVSLIGKLLGEMRRAPSLQESAI